MSSPLGDKRPDLSQTPGRSVQLPVPDSPEQPTLVHTPGSITPSKRGATLSHHSTRESSSGRARYTYSTKTGGPSKEGNIRFLESLKEKPAHDHYHRSHTFGYGRPLKLRHIIKRPVVRQWICEGIIYRERDERESTRFELFFDLIFVGIIYQIAKSIREFNGLSVATVILTLYPPFSIWQECRGFINVHGSDDLIERGYILFNMVCLLGYVANASAIHFETETASSSDYVIASLRPALLFFLTAKLVRIGIGAVYIYYLPKFRHSMAISTVFSALFLLPLIPLLAITNKPVLFWALMSTSLFLEIFGRFLHLMYYRLVMPRLTQSKACKMPCTNIEHHIDRVNAFVILFLGEAILSVTYQASAEEGTIGFENQKFGRCALGLLSAFFLCWLYFDLEHHHAFVHALRRHWLTGMLHIIVHFPFIIALTCASRALEVLAEDKEAEQGVRWYWSGGIGASLICFGLLSILHKSLDRRGSGKVSHEGRCLARVIGGIIIICLPLSETLSSSIKTLGTTVAVLFALVTFDVVSKLGVSMCPETAREYQDVIVPMGWDGESEGDATMADLKAEEAQIRLEKEALQSQQHAETLNAALKKIEARRCCERRRKCEEAAAL